MQKNRILFLAYYAPPVQVTGNIRRFHLLQECKKYFDQIHVVTSSNAELMLVDTSLNVPSIYLCKVSTLDIRRLLLLLKKDTSPTVRASRKKNQAFRFFRRLSDSFPFNLALDDGSLIYMWNAYHEASKIIKTQQITHVFSSFRPVADHIVARLLKYRFPHLIWIADYRDLPVDPIRKNTILPSIQHIFQRWLLKPASIVTTVSEGLKRNLDRYHNRLYVLANALPVSASPTEIQLPPKFRVSYTGSLYPRLQDARSFFRAIQELSIQGVINFDNFELMYAGKDGKLWDKWLATYEILHLGVNKGLLPYTEALKLQRESHLNLMLTWASIESKGILMSKLGAYHAAGRPLMVLINGPKDEELERKVAGKLFYSQDPKITAGILKYLKQLQKWDVEGRHEKFVVLIEQINGNNWQIEVQQFIEWASNIDPTFAIPSRIQKS